MRDVSAQIRHTIRKRQRKAEASGTAHTRLHMDWLEGMLMQLQSLSMSQWYEPEMDIEDAIIIPQEVF